jgi:outer membrane protein
MNWYKSIGLVATLLGGSAAIHADTLGDIYELALKNDSQLKAAQAQYRANLENENLSRAALLPQINGSYEINKRDQDQKSNSIDFDPSSRQFGFIDTVSNTDTDTEGYTVSLNQKIFDLPAWFSFAAGKELTKQAESQFAYDQQALILRVTEAYLRVLSGLTNLSSARAQEKAFSRQLEQTQQRFEVGLIAVTDVHEARAGHDLAVVARLTSENNLGVAYEQIQVLTGRTHSSLHILNEDFPITIPSPEERSDWVDFALKNNYQLKAAAYGAEASRQSARSNEARHFPTVSGSFSYSDMNTNGDLERNPAALFDLPPKSQTETESLQIRMDLPLYSGGAISAKRRQSYEQYLSAHEQHTHLMRNVVMQTRSLHLTVNTDVARVQAHRQGIISAQSALDATQAGYEVGTRNVVDVLNAQQLLFSSQRDYADTRHDYVFNLLRLKGQAGTLSPQDIYDLDKWLIEPPAPSIKGPG